jgi:hypothetical protein
MEGVLQNPQLFLWHQKNSIDHKGFPRVGFIAGHCSRNEGPCEVDLWSDTDGNPPQRLVIWMKQHSADTSLPSILTHPTPVVLGAFPSLIARKVQ